MNKTLALLSAALLLAACSEGGKEPAATPAASAPQPAASQAASAPKITTCNIETVANAPFKGAVPPLPTHGRIRFTGWAIDTEAHNVPKTAVLHLVSADGTVTRDAPIVMWRTRPDVARANGNDAAYQDSGFSVDLVTDHLAAGNYDVTIRYSDAKSCSVTRRVTVQ